MPRNKSGKLPRAPLDLMRLQHPLHPDADYDVTSIPSPGGQGCRMCQLAPSIIAGVQKLSTMAQLSELRSYYLAIDSN
jgi:hypothetical protein